MYATDKVLFELKIMKQAGHTLSAFACSSLKKYIVFIVLTPQSSKRALLSCSEVHGNDSILVTRMRFTVWLRARAQMKQCSITTREAA
jgi:hypothetical protein